MALLARKDIGSLSPQQSVAYALASVAYALAMGWVAPSDKLVGKAGSLAEQMSRALSPRELTLAKVKAKELVDNKFVDLSVHETMELLQTSPRF